MVMSCIPVRSSTLPSSLRPECAASGTPAKLKCMPSRRYLSIRAKLAGEHGRQGSPDQHDE